MSPASAGGLHIGVTASRTGLTGEQVEAAVTLLSGWRSAGTISSVPPTLHHGDCVGGDEALAVLARHLGYWIVGHPPTDARLRAWFHSDKECPPRDYLSRNRAIVAASAYLLAFPRSMTPPRRGGTWYTIGHALSVGKAPIVVAPDGAVTR